MGALTESTPKPLLPVGGKPMLEHIVGRMSSAGMQRFLIVVGHGARQIEKHFKRLDYKVEFVRQEPVNGTATAALLGEKFAGDQPFLLSFGDILCQELEYRKLQQAMVNKPSATAVLAVKEVDDPWQGAAIYEIGGRLTRIVEKPEKGTSNTRWNSAGIYACKAVLFNYLQKVQPSVRGEYELTSAFELMLSDRLELLISAISGEWRDVGRPEDLAEVNAQVSET